MHKNEISTNHWLDPRGSSTEWTKRRRTMRPSTAVLAPTRNPSPNHPQDDTMLFRGMIISCLSHSYHPCVRKIHRLKWVPASSIPTSASSVSATTDFLEDAVMMNYHGQEKARVNWTPNTRYVSQYDCSWRVSFSVSYILNDLYKVRLPRGSERHFK